LQQLYISFQYYNKPLQYFHLMIILRLLLNYSIFLIHLYQPNTCMMLEIMVQSKKIQNH